MQSFPGFAERAEAAFGSALTRDASAWRVAATVAPFSAGGASDSDEGDDEGAAFCKAFEAEPEDAADDVLARADSSPPHHLVAEANADDDAEPARRTVYVLDVPLYVGSGSRGATSPAAAPAPSAEREEPRRGADDAPPPRPQHEAVRFQGTLRRRRVNQLWPDAQRPLAAREGVKRVRASAPAKPAVALVPSTQADADAAEDEEAAAAPSEHAAPGQRKKRMLRRAPHEDEDDARTVA